MELTQEDFVKRKRIKNSVPLYERCMALKSNGKQCTRRKKGNCKFCGTHIKGTQNGVVNNTGNDTGVPLCLMVSYLKSPVLAHKKI